MTKSENFKMNKKNWQFKCIVFSAQNKVSKLLACQHIFVRCLKVKYENVEATNQFSFQGFIENFSQLSQMSGFPKKKRSWNRNSVSMLLKPGKM